MADYDQLPRLPGIKYCPEEDVRVTNPGRTNRYVKGIASAIERLDLLRTYLASEECGSSNICIELALSIQHYLRMFRTIIMAINNPSDMVKDTLDYIEMTEQKVNTIILSKNWRDNGTEVPSISPYELAIRVIIDNCMRAGQAKGVKDLMTEIVAQLKSLYGNFKPSANEDGTPRTIAFCISGEKPDELCVSVATSKDVWMPGSFLQKWVMKARAVRFGEKGRQACESVIHEVDQVVKFSNENEKIEVLRLVSNRYVARNLRQLDAQAFNGKNFDKRDRYWRCRLIFGFTWLSNEADPTTATEKDVTDFEGRWQGCLSKSGNLEVECGKCAEYLLWVELPPEKIPLPQDEDLPSNLSLENQSA